MSLTPPWLTWARGEIGIREIAGPNHTARIVAYWRLGKVPLGVSDDETPWCAAFACAALEESGVRSPRTARARGFAESKDWMRPCDPRLGAIVVLSSNRGPRSGHVGFLTGINDSQVVLLGGNQGNAVSEAPFQRGRVVGMYWPAERGTDWTRYPVPPRFVRTGGPDVSDR